MAGGGKTILTNDLIETCIRILKKHRPIQSFSYPLVGLLREMAMTLEQLQRLRLSKAQAISNLDGFHAKFRNRILRIRRQPREPQELRNERDNNEFRFQSMLVQLESQRRTTIGQFEQIERELEMRLTQLLNRYDTVTMDNGNV